MSQVVIDLRPQVKHQDGHGREVLADVHFRIDVQAYVNNFYTYTKEARKESEKACEAYYSEVVEMLKAEGWTLRKEKYGVGDCPQMVKGTQYLYCHPQDISGQVNPADIEALEAKIKALTSCKYYKTDNYGDIIVTTSESDEKQLYRDTYADGLASIWQEVTTTKRSNMYKDKAEAESCVRRRICIANRRADLNDIGTGSYNMRSPLLQFLMEEYDRLLQAGYIKEATGQNGRTICRWINKKEEKELNKARREAEKAEKERKAATLESAPEIKAIDVLQVGTMVRMPGVIGGLRVEEIDRKGNRVICVDGCKERHTYKGLDYFTTTAEEIRIPEWLRICQYFYIGPKSVKTNRVLCTDIIPCSDQEKPVVIVYNDHEGQERKIFLSSGLDNANHTDIESLTAKYQEQIVNNMQLGCGCIVTDGDENRKDSKWLKVRKAYTNDSRNPKDWTYCVCWYDVEATDGDGYRETLRECENGVRLEQAARAMALFEMDCKATLETSSEITEQREQNDACISSAESRRDKANGQITDGAKKESFGKMFIYRLYIKWKWMQQRFERIGDMDRAAYCFYHRLRLTKLYIYQPGWRIMDYGDMKPIFFPRQRIK